MSNATFNTDAYENQLALVLLETIFKKDMLAQKTYSNVKKILNEQEDTIVTTLKPTSPTSV